MGEAEPEERSRSPGAEGLAGGLALVGLLGLVALAAASSAQQPYDLALTGMGVAFTHAGNPNADATYAEIMGSGVCVFDYDGDDWEDLFFVNGRYANLSLQDSQDPRSALYHNENGTEFKKVADALNISAWGMGCATGDYDDDGDQDVAISKWGGNELWRNDGQDTFTNVTDIAGIAHPYCPTVECFGASLGFLDYDKDGDLDLYVLNYVAWDGSGPAAPNIYAGQCNVLFRNNDDGTFTDVSDGAGAADCGNNHLALAIADIDGNGYQDIFIASDESPDTFLQNNGNGTFTDLSFWSGLDDPRGGMGADWGDYDGDGDLDLVITHFEGERFALYQQGATASFKDRAVQAGLDMTRDYVGWGARFLDYDADTDQDLLIANGHVNVSYGGVIGYDQWNLVFRNNGNGTFTNVSEDVWHPKAATQVTRGLATGDLDQDGYLDVVFVNNPNQSAETYRSARGRNNWLYLRLAGNQTINPQAIGAVVEVHAGGKVLEQELLGGNSYLSASSRDLHFGLGAATSADKVVVHWPDNTTLEFSDVLANRLVRVVPQAQGPQNLRTWPLAGSPGVVKGNRLDTVALVGEVLRAPDPVTATWTVRSQIFTGTTAELSFPDLGTYQALFRIQDGKARWDEAETLVVIENLPPTPVLKAAATADRLTSVVLDATGSLDRDGQVVNWTWSVEGKTYHGSLVQHAFASLGAQVVTLTLRDNEGATGQATAIVQVVNLAPAARLEAPSTTDRLTNTGLNGSSSSDRDGQVVNWTWSVEGETLYGAVVQHTFATLGAREVRLTVRDNEGATGTATTTVQVVNLAPAAVAKASPTVGEFGTLFTLDGSASSDPDGSIAKWAWAFGDGTTAQGAVVSKAYTAGGTFLVTLTAEDNDRATAQAAVQVVVRDPLPPPDTTAPVSSLAIGEPRLVTALVFVRSATPLTLSAEDPVVDNVTSGVAFTERRLHHSADLGASWGLALDWTPVTAPFRIEGPDGLYLLSYRSVDRAGNVEKPQERDVFLDNTAPATGLGVGAPRHDAGTRFVTSASALDLAARDTPAGGAASGVGLTERRLSYSPDLGATWTLVHDWLPATAPFHLQGGDGLYALEYRSRDRLGNTEAGNRAELFLDNTPPRTRLDVAEPALRLQLTFVGGGTMLALPAVDPAVGGGASGLAGTERRLWHSTDLGAGWAVAQDWSAAGAPFRLPGPDGLYRVEFRSRDALGNSETLHEELFLDTTPPRSRLEVGAPSFAGQALFVGAQAPIALPALDPPVGGAASGVALTQRRISFGGDLGAWWVPVGDWSAGAAAFALAGADGFYRVEFHSRDAMGNVEPLQAARLALDTAPPLLALAPGEPSARAAWGPVVGPETVSRVLADDPGGLPSGVSSTEARLRRLTGEPAEQALPAGAEVVSFQVRGDDGRYEVLVRSEDRVGNAREAVFPLGVDATLPLAGLLAPAPGEVCTSALQPAEVVSEEIAPAPRCAGTGDADGDGLADAHERAAGSDAARALSTPLTREAAGNPGFEEPGGAGEVAAGWVGRGSLGWARVGENAPWSAMPGPEGGELRAAVRAALAELWEGAPGAALRGLEEQAAQALAERAPRSWAAAEEVLKLLEFLRERHAPQLPSLPPGGAAESVADWLLDALARMPPAEQASIEARGEGAGALMHAWASSPGQARRCGFLGLALDLLPDARLEGLAVRVRGWDPTGSPVELVARLGPGDWVAHAWNRLEVPASSFQAAPAAPPASLCLGAVELELRAGPAEGPLDTAVARLDNLGVYVLARRPEAVPGLPALPALPLAAPAEAPGDAPAAALPPGTLARPALVQGVVEVLLDGLDVQVDGVAAGVRCVTLEASDSQGPRRAWSSCEGTLQPTGQGGFRAVWDTAGFHCLVELRAQALDELGRVAERRSTVLVVPSGPDAAEAAQDCGADLAGPLPEPPTPPALPALPEGALPEVPPLAWAATRPEPV